MLMRVTLLHQALRSLRLLSGRTHLKMRLKQRFYVCQLTVEEGTSASPTTASELFSALKVCAGTGVVYCNIACVRNAASSAAHRNRDASSCLQSCVAENFGEIGVGAVSSLLSVKYYNPVTRLCVIRGPTAADREVHAAMSLLRVIRRQRCALHVLATCGTVRTLKPALEHWHVCILASMRASASSDDMALDPSFLEALDADLENAKL